VKEVKNILFLKMNDIFNSQENQVRKNLVDYLVLNQNFLMMNKDC
jgi:hypothetical protein